MKSVVIPGVGTFALESGSFRCSRNFFADKAIDVLIYPKLDGGEPTDAWKAAIAQTYSLFAEKLESEIQRLPDMVRKLCREYDMYEDVEIPWTDSELLDGLRWGNIKLANDGTVECCADPSQRPANNFTIVFGFDKEAKLEYAHFDG